MKKFLMMLLVSLIIGACFSVGYYLYKSADNRKNNEKIAKTEYVVHNTNENSSIITSELNETVERVEIDEKVSPNCTLILKKYYKKCGHTTKDYATIPEELVNKTEQEVKEMYNNWKVIGFSSEEIVLYREVDGICNEHYILKDLDGYIAIYNIDENGKEFLKEKTEITTQYLPKEDLNRIKQGIKAEGKEELNSKLEDFE